MEPHTVDTNPRGTASELTTSTAFELLSNDRRRLVAQLLSDRSEPVALEELAAEVASCDGSRSADGSDVLTVELHHCHLPALADAGLVRYDRDTNRLTPLPALSRFTDAFDFDDVVNATRSAN